MSTATAGTPASGTYVGSTPGSGAFDMFQATAEQAYQDSLNQLQAQRSNMLNAAGMGEDASGNLSVDANAPTGSYQQMMSQNATQHASDMAGLAGVGFKGGLANQGAEASHSNTSINAQNWAQQFAQNLANNTGQQTNATDSYQQSLVQEMENEITSGITNQQFNPANPGTTTTPPPTTSGTLPSTDAGLGKTKAGQTIYGYGVNGNVFTSAAQARAHGRYGKKKGQA